VHQPSPTPARVLGHSISRPTAISFRIKPDMRIQFSRRTARGYIWKGATTTRTCGRVRWAGYNFASGKKLVLDVTPMIGGVFVRTTGIAPGCEASLTFRELQLSISNEYVFDTTHKSGIFTTHGLNLSTRHRAGFAWDWWRNAQRLFKPAWTCSAGSSSVSPIRSGNPQSTFSTVVLLTRPWCLKLG
jgi:hypothetical protein